MNRKWLDACLRRVAEMQYDLVIPTSDPVILPLQEHRRELDPRQFYLLEEEAFKVTNDKAKTYELAALLGISVPSQRIVATENEAEEAADLFGYPLILKPTQSFTLDGGDDKQYVRRAEDAVVLRQLLPACCTPALSPCSRFSEVMAWASKYWREAGASWRAFNASALTNRCTGAEAPTAEAFR